MDNISAAREANLIVVSVPYDALQARLKQCARLSRANRGRCLRSNCPANIRTVHVPEGKAASLEAQAILGPGVKVVAAFQNVSAIHLKDAATPLTAMCWSAVTTTRRKKRQSSWHRQPECAVWMQVRWQMPLPLSPLRQY